MVSKAVFFYSLILGGIFLIIVSGVMMLKEVESAQEYCNSINGTYKFGVYHICNEEVIQKYKIFGKEFWGFEIALIDLQNASRELNWSKIEEVN
jgi:hypothetical protein